MTGPELDETLRAIGWSRSEFGRRIGRRPAYIDAWAAGRRSIPEWASAYLIALNAAIADVPRPAEAKP